MLASPSFFNACEGIAVDVVCPFMALLSFRGIDTPSLAAQGERRRLSLFNIRRDNSPVSCHKSSPLWSRAASVPACSTARPSIYCAGREGRFVMMVAKARGDGNQPDDTG